MAQYLILLLFLFPVIGMCQVEHPKDANLLDSKNDFTNSRFDINENGFYGRTKAYRQFYTDGKVAAIIHYAIDKKNVLSGNKAGLSKEYYHNGQLRSKGNYAMYSLLYASGITTTRRLETSFKTGLWEYYYENGQIKAKGEYEIKTLSASTGVNNQFKKQPFITNQWLFYNEDGSIAEDKQQIIRDIEHDPNDG